MDLDVGSQVLINGHPGVVLAVTPFAACSVVTAFWPGTRTPPQEQGLARPGSWTTKCVTLLALPNGRYVKEATQLVRLQRNPDPSTHIQLDTWLDAFAARCRT